MKKLSKNEFGFGAVEILLVILVIAVVGGAGYWIYSRNNKSNDSSKTSTPTSSSTTTSPATNNQQEKVDYGKLTIKETGVSFELSKDIQDAYYLSDTTGGASFGVKSLDNVNGCKTKKDDIDVLHGVAVLHYGGGGGNEEYQSFKNNPNSSQVADKFFFVIDADKTCLSSDTATQKKIEAVQAAFENAGKSIKIKDFSNSYYNQ